MIINSPLPAQATSSARQTESALNAHLPQVQARKLEALIADINSGMALEEVLENVYAKFRGIIPYHRIGLSLIEDNGNTARAVWTKGERPATQIAKGYTAPLSGSSLQTIANTGQPRIINDLPAYLEKKPSSTSTRLIVADGIRSSLTCPLAANGKTIGFIFFSSAELNTYSESDASIFRLLAGEMSAAIERAAILKQSAELRRLNERKDFAIDMTAHDLRHSLAAIQMTAKLLLENGRDIPEEQRGAFTRNIANQARDTLALLNNILDANQIEAGQLNLQLVSIDVKRFIEEAVGERAPLAAGKNARLSLLDVPPGNMTIDPARARQVLDNLISNAVKFSPPGAHITVRVERLLSDWRVSIADQGPGIQPQERQLLFQKFSRLSTKPTGGEKSTGLGLIIARQLIEAHGGRLGVDSEPGRGATFWFTVPA